MRFAKAFVFVFMLSFVFSSCALKKGKQFNEIRLKEKYCKNLTYCAIGIGKSKEEAKSDAKINLASQIYSFVFSDYEKTVKIDKNQNIDENKKSELKIFTNLYLINVKELKAGKIDDYYFYITSISSSDAKKIREKYRKTITAVSYVEKIESENDISSIIGLLKDLQKEIKIKNIEDEDFFSKKYNKVFSFKSYINFQIKYILNFIDAVLTPDGIYIINRKTFQPIPDIKIIVVDNKNNKITEVTDDKGLVKLPFNISYPINIYLDFEDYDLENLLIAKRYKKENPYIKIYIKTNPDKLYFKLFENDNVIKEGMIPYVVKIKYSSSNEYKIKIFGDDYVPIEERLKLVRGYDYYIYKNVGKLKYGYLDLKVKGDAYLIITSQSGLTVLDERYRKSEFKGKVPVGTYNITIKKKENTDQYQIIDDQIFVKKDQKIKRTYFEPEDREYYFEREGNGVGFIYSGRSTNKEIEYECTYSYGCDSYEKPGIGEVEVGSSFGLYYKKFLTHTYWGFDIGFAYIVDNSSYSSGNDNSNGTGYYGDIGGGVYFGTSGILEIGGGIYATSSEYDLGDYKAKFSATGPYIGVKIGYAFNSKDAPGAKSGFYIGLGYKHVFLKDNKYLEIITLDLGGVSFKERSGYRKPAHVKALRDIHYEED